MKSWRSLFMGRKFLVVAFVLVSAFILALRKMLTAEYVTIAGVAIAAFNAADAFVSSRMPPEERGSNGGN